MDWAIKQHGFLTWTEKVVSVQIPTGSRDEDGNTFFSNDCGGGFVRVFSTDEAAGLSKFSTGGEEDVYVWPGTEADHY